jgi:hypothetical protein
MTLSPYDVRKPTLYTFGFPYKAESRRAGQLLKDREMAKGAPGNDEVKDIRDQAIAAEAYSRQARNTELEQKACEIRAAC